MKTYWTHSVYAIEESGDRCLVTGFAETLGEAIASLYKDGTYYQTECGYTVRATLHEHCEQCKGTGAVRRVNGKGSKNCPACKGQPTRQIVDVDELPATYTIQHARPASQIVTPTEGTDP